MELVFGVLWRFFGTFFRCFIAEKMTQIYAILRTKFLSAEICYFSTTWSPREQALLPPVLRGQALVLMSVHRHLCLTATRRSPVDGVERAIKRRRLTTLSGLPRAVWLLVVGFAVRRCELEAVRALGFPHVD